MQLEATISGFLHGDVLIIVNCNRIHLSHRLDRTNFWIEQNGRLRDIPANVTGECSQLFFIWMGE